jgi:hypothetical protein
MRLPIDQEMSEGFAQSIHKHLNTGIDGTVYTNWSLEGNLLTFKSIRGRYVEVEVKAFALREEIDSVYIGED